MSQSLMMFALTADGSLEEDEKGKFFWIKSYDVEVYQPIDQSGLPNGNPRAGTIHLVLYMGTENDLQLVEQWIVAAGYMKSGTIAPDPDSHINTFDFGLLFYNAFCIRYRQTYDSVYNASDGSSPCLIHLTISAQTIVFLASDEKLVNEWPGVPPAQIESKSSAPISNKLDFD
ncbi:type VI secretion system tube protein TssD [Niabella ginsengisoli]|uniref:Uncharacterized protein n=1 Tax=Niabella ginsengisoli TaxID=522298 RepID=A0ABS9SHC5_9BACT|nr:type VI secretion system tube protein TssD [Niabella ginsengisoli]MCH5597559.1 hypothetical protein [Niabella ginsengisoli]